jgi:hypothetical protein
MRESKQFYSDIIHTGEFTPKGSRYTIKYEGKYKDTNDDVFKLIGTFSKMTIPNSTIRFIGGIDSYKIDNVMLEGSPKFNVDIIDETTLESKPLLVNGRPPAKNIATGGRRGRRKTKRARRGRRRSSRRA